MSRSSNRTTLRRGATLPGFQQGASRTPTRPHAIWSSGRSWWSSVVFPEPARPISRALEDVGDLSWRPFAAARRWHAARVQDVGDFAQALTLGPQRLDRGQNVGGKPVRGGLHALGALAPHLAEARIAEPRAFGLLAPAPPWCEPRSSPAPSRRARHRCGRGSTLRCLSIEVVAASSNSSRQTLARKG